MPFLLETDPALKEEIIREMLAVAEATDLIRTDDMAWIEVILRRSDLQNGVAQLLQLIEDCQTYNNEKDELSPLNKLIRQAAVDQKLYALKSLFYRQRYVLVVVTTRTKPRCEQPPNLGNLLVPQNVRVDFETVHGLGYAESRNYAANKFMSNPRYSHLMYIDDDVIVPVDVIKTLLECNLDIVAANYTKKHSSLETVTTTISHDPDPTILFSNVMVPAKPNDMTPIPCNATGFGCIMLSRKAFQVVPQPWFEFIKEQQPDGSMKTLVGEDTRFLQKALMAGLTPHVVPGLCGIHVDLASRTAFAPEHLVDPKTRQVLPEVLDKYCRFLVDPRELAGLDISDEFNHNKHPHWQQAAKDAQVIRKQNEKQKSKKGSHFR